MKFKIHQITPQFIQALKDAGFTNLKQREVENAAIHNVTPAFIKRVQDSGAFGKDLSLQDYVELKIHGVERKLRKQR